MVARQGRHSRVWGQPNSWPGRRPPEWGEGGGEGGGGGPRGRIMKLGPKGGERRERKRKACYVLGQMSTCEMKVMENGKNNA